MSHFIPEPRNLAEVTRSPTDAKTARLKATLKEIKKFNNREFLMDEPDKGGPATPLMDIYKENIQSDGSLDKSKLRIVVRG